MKVAQVTFYLAALLKISIVLFPAREQVYIFYKVARTRRNHLVMSIIMVCFSFLVPAVYPDITSILGLLGGIVMGTMGYSIPLLLKLASLRGQPISFTKVGTFLLLAFVLVIKVMSAYVSLFLPSTGGSSH